MFRNLPSNSVTESGGLDPAPRSYAPTVSLLRRSRFCLDLKNRIHPDELVDWMLGPASNINDTVALTEGFAGRLAKAGLGVGRLSLNVGTLHPQAFGYAWNWSTTDGFCDEIQIGEETLHSDAYRKNPLFEVMEYGKSVRVSLDPALMETTDSALMNTLFDEGFTDYVALPMSASCGRFNAVTLATRQAGGFGEDQLATLRYLIKLFGLHVDRHIASRITKNISHTYLGEEAGEQVVKGTIKRGTGAPIEAVVWSSDMRGFSALSQNMNNRAIAALLDRYFSAMADAVIDHGGDVLKFIGDGMLAVFPLTEFETPQQAARAAAKAARQALQTLDRTNDEMKTDGGWVPLKAGIGLHLGEVFFGNIGSVKRLDFTVIGDAVNVASRIESCCKMLQRDLLFSSEIASLFDLNEVEPLGAHSLKGIEAPKLLFSLVRSV